MTRAVKTRPYDSTRRHAASHERRAAILAAARELFLERGYQRTTMAAVAQGAGVALDTVYELVGRKPDLFRLLLETSISGGTEPVPAEERGYVRQIHAEPTAAGKLSTYARALPAIHAQLAPLIAVVHAAATAEPEINRLWQGITHRRAANMRRLALELEATGELAVSIDEAADVIWATNSPEFYVLLVHERGWSPDRYADWLTTSWQRLLLRQPAPDRG